VQTEAADSSKRTSALSLRKDARLISVASAVRRKPPRSSTARGVTATVNSHRPAANGKRKEERASMRTIASPPGSQLRALVRIEKRNGGDTATTSVASTIIAADRTESRRTRSASK